jgi:hypothetical protein
MAMARPGGGRRLCTRVRCKRGELDFFLKPMLSMATFSIGTIAESTE